MKRSWMVVLPWSLALAAVLQVGGCTSLKGLAVLGPPVTPHCQVPDGLELIVGAHRNAPVPRLNSRLVCRVTAAILAGKPVRIVVAAGQPQLVSLRLVSPSVGTLAQQGSPRLQEDVQRVLSAIARTRPSSPGVDDLGALAVAADQARSKGCPHAELVLIDSGLDDRGALDFTVPGMLAATPAEVARQLRASGNLPDLHGFTIILVGIGYTASPQAPLSTKWRSSVAHIWAAVLRAAGAKVQIIPQPGQGPSVNTDEPVKSVPVPATQPVDPGKHMTIIFTGESPVRFEPNTTVFVDRAAALQALRPIAWWLTGDPARQAFLEGTTADVGMMAGQVGLAWARADHVKAELVALGAAASQITTKGVGSNFPQFVPDRSAAGILLAGPATLNRSVRITLRQSS